jgi:hypothetical protein
VPSNFITHRMTLLCLVLTKSHNQEKGSLRLGA